MNPIVILNAHSQVLVVSIAEVMVCWVIVGASFESLVKSRGRIASLVVGILTPDIFFGIYHFAHSPPFNQIGMVLFLMIPGLVTSLVYFLGVMFLPLLCFTTSSAFQVLCARLTWRPLVSHFTPSMLWLLYQSSFS